MLSKNTNMGSHEHRLSEGKTDTLLTQDSVKLHNLRRAGLCETSGSFKKEYKVQSQQMMSKDPGTFKDLN